jgi:hypothetical protein
MSPIRIRDRRQDLVVQSPLDPQVEALAGMAGTGVRAVVAVAAVIEV